MKETDELEPQQYERHYWEDDVPLKDVRKNAMRKAVYIGFVLFLLIIVAGAFIKFPDEVALPFVLKGDAAERIYRFPYPVYIEEVYGASGKQVKKGERLVRITAPQIVSLINNYRQAEDALANYRTNKTRSLSDTRQMVHLQASQNRNRLMEIASRQTALDRTWKSNEARLQFELETANKKLAQNKDLYQARYISALEFKEYEAAQVRASDALTTAAQLHSREIAALKEEASRYALQNTSLTHEEDRFAIDSRTDSATLFSNYVLARDAIQHSFGDFEISDGSLVLGADDDGTLSFLFEGDREVPASAILLKLSPSAKGLYASAVSPPSLIGKLQKDQTVYLKVATFPAYEWGAAKGHIGSMSLTPDEKGVFNVKVTIDEQRRLANLLQPGMNGTLTVQLRERTFFQYFFRALQKASSVVRGE